MGGCCVFCPIHVEYLDCLDVYLIHQKFWKSYEVKKLYNIRDVGHTKSTALNTIQQAQELLFCFIIFIISNNTMNVIPS